jgi:hypothetical protein
MEKKFVIYWDETYDSEKAEVVGLGFFTADKGFGIEEQSAVELIETGGHTLIDNGHVVVLRVK